MPTTETTLLQVAQLGHPILRKKTKEVTNISSTEVQSLIDDMIATVMDVDGVGIAAPQVYKSIRLFIIASHPNARYPHAPLMEPTAIINPKIIKTSEEILKDWEGCLSIPGIRGFVPRYQSIDVEYTTREGRQVKQAFTDFVARIFQHEFDHIEGIMFIDRIESSKDLISEKEYQKLMNKKKPPKKILHLKRLSNHL